MCLAAALLWLGEAAALTSQKITGGVTRPLLKKQARREHTFDSNSTDNKSKNKSVGLQRSKKLLRSKRNHQKKKQPAQRERASAKPRDGGGGNTQSRKGPSEPTANKLTTGLKTGGSERFRTRPRAWPAGTRKGLGGTARRGQAGENHGDTSPLTGQNGCSREDEHRARARVWGGGGPVPPAGLYPGPGTAGMTWRLLRNLKPGLARDPAIPPEHTSKRSENGEWKGICTQGRCRVTHDKV